MTKFKDCYHRTTTLLKTLRYEMTDFINENITILLFES